jgi:hypothetical protein
MTEETSQQLPSMKPSDEADAPQLPTGCATRWKQTGNEKTDEMFMKWKNGKVGWK